MVQRVRVELALGAEGYPDLGSVAARLLISSRTLKRRLQQCGTSFQELRDEARHRDALRLLENPDLEIRQIAAALGYRDPPSFSRAFRRWTGRTPLQARAPRA
ncbi:MAG: helix-turn-helix transcriptional regulator [Nevskia sp.]|nr:helix-turn-helix transcriptional regulator [Nevskia sp.]